MHPEGLSIIGPLALRELRFSTWGRELDSVGGLTLGADPISYAISYASWLDAHPAPDHASRLVAAARGQSMPALRAFTVRKEAKKHGTGQLIEGPFSPGDKVAIIEDVITTGGSALKAAESVRESGGDVRGVLALVDREEGGLQAIEAKGFPVLALMSAAEIVAHMETRASKP
jgi:orotate phosphoribosyltransferase